MKNEKYYMVDIEKPANGSYIVLETLNKDKNANRIIHVLKPGPEKSAFKLGRGHESDVRIADISVSRLHATIKCTKDGFFIDDNNSKFGTLVLLRNAASLDPAESKAIQVGRTVISLSVKPQQIERYFFNILFLFQQVEQCNFISRS